MLDVAFLTLLAVLARCAWSLKGRRGEGFGLPAVAILVFAYLYAVQPLYLIWTERIEIFLTDAQVAKGVLIPAAMLAAFVSGWVRGARSFVFRREPQCLENRGRWWTYGLVSASAGLLLYVIFLGRSGGFEQAFSAQHGHAMAWQENTAYLYSGPWWVLSGSAMMILAAYRSPWAAWRRITPLCYLGALSVNAVLLGSRGMTFAITTTLVVSLALARRTHTRLSQAIWFLIPTCLVVLLILGFRSVLYLGEDKPQTPDLRTALTASMDIDDTHASLGMTGVEFIYHAAALDTVDAKQKYHLALGWLYVYTVHPIPRIWWPEKPYQFDSPGITGDDIFEVTGLRVAGGAAAGIVADLYWHFGLASVGFFYLFGRYARQLYLRAQLGDSVLAATAYVMLYALSLNCFAQGFGAILVALPFSLGPAVAFYFASRCSRAPRLRRCVAGDAGIPHRGLSCEERVLPT